MGACGADLLMATGAKRITLLAGLTREYRITQLMHRMAGHTIDAAVGMPGFPPVQILLVMPLGIFIGVQVFITRANRLVINLKRLSGSIANGPAGAF